MKKIIFIIGLLALISCHKKYEEKTGNFHGIEETTNGESEATYTLSYNKQFKIYEVSSSTNALPIQRIDRADFEDGYHLVENGSLDLIFSSVGNSGFCQITLDENELHVDFFNEGHNPNSISFSGTRL